MVRPGFEPRYFGSKIRELNHYTKLPWMNNKDSISECWVVNTDEVMVLKIYFQACPEFINPDKDCQVGLKLSCVVDGDLDTCMMTK